MAANTVPTTVIVPLGSTVYYAITSATTITPLPGPSPVITGSGTTTLYIPIIAPSSSNVANVAAMSSALAGDNLQPLSAWYGVAGQTLLSVSADNTSLAIPEGQTLWIPNHSSLVPPSVNVQSAIGALQPNLRAEGASVTSMSTTPTSMSAASTSMSTAPQTGSDQPSSTSAVSGASNATNGTSSPIATNSSKTFDSGSLAGGIVGAFLGGILVALVLACVLFRRRKRSNQRPAFAAPKGLSSDTRSNDDVHYNETRSSKIMGVASWEKHLPQEKDDKTIVQAVKSVIEQAQIHVEGYYKASSGKVPSGNIEALESIAGDEVPRLLLRSDCSLPILEGILIRWIVHRISLRSAPGDSLLPEVFSKIAKENNWHMEIDSGVIPRNKKSKQGFSEAFSKWRVLTGYLYSGVNKDPEFRNNLDTKIHQASKSLADALAPWSASSKDVANREESLREILHKASDVGVMLFTQPSTFLFDWPATSKGSIAVSPALVERSGDEGILRTFIEAKVARV